MQKISIVVHGGAGTILKDQMNKRKEASYKKALQQAIEKGYTALIQGGTAIDAVENAIKHLEDSPLFNAGKGSVFTNEGTHEMDASIMDGKNLRAGAVSLIQGIKNPISLARDVMEKSPHVYLAGRGAIRFAQNLGYPIKKPKYFYDEFRYKQWQNIKHTDKTALDHSLQNEVNLGTVGAVACDSKGNIAAATSTGGMTNKPCGRIGDSPIIGAGTYADNKTCAVSCTGDGEFFIRGVLAHHLSCLIAYKKLSLIEAAQAVILKHLNPMGGKGGLIVINKSGEIAMEFNTSGMYRGYKSSLQDGSKEETSISIYRET